jgi:hypothetical protein
MLLKVFNILSFSQLLRGSVFNVNLSLNMFKVVCFILFYTMSTMSFAAPTPERTEPGLVFSLFYMFLLS